MGLCYYFCFVFFSRQPQPTLNSKTAQRIRCRNPFRDDQKHVVFFFFSHRIYILPVEFDCCARADGKRSDRLARFPRRTATLHAAARTIQYCCCCVGELRHRISPHKINPTLLTIFYRYIPFPNHKHRWKIVVDSAPAVLRTKRIYDDTFVLIQQYGRFERVA